MRLQDGAGPSNGYVEFCKDRRWGGACSNVQDSHLARVVCRQLGFDQEGICMDIIIQVEKSFL